MESSARSIGKREEGSAKGRQPIPPSSSSGSPIAAAQVVATGEEPKGIKNEVPQSDASQPMTIENLIKVAQQIVQGQPTGSSMSTGDPSSPSLRVMRMVNPIHGSDGTIVKATALVDSGATHPLRKAASSEEWENARAVTVNLAGNRSVEMKLTTSGTLLLPVSEMGSSTILPVGDLIQTLGYKLDWNRKSCRLIAPDGESMKLSMRDGCPQLPEYQALSLISRLEERKLEQLRNVTLETEDAVRAAALRMERSWFDSLLEFCKGDLSAGQMAVDKSPFLKDVPESSKTGLITTYSFPSQYTLVQSNIITFSHSTQAWTFPFFCEAWGTHCRFEHTHIQQVLFKKTQRAPASYPAREKLLQVKKGEDALPLIQQVPARFLQV